MKLNPIRHNHSVCLLLYHFVTTTKYRRKELTADITKELIQDAITNYRLQIHSLSVEPDHIHIMVQAPTTHSPADIARIIKSFSSRAIRKVLPEFSGWSAGYYISTTGGVATETVQKYIENQGFTCGSADVL